MEALDLLLDNPVVLLAVLFVGAVIGAGVERVTNAAERAKKRAYWQGRNAEKGKAGRLRKDKATIPLKVTPERVVHDAAEQLRCVMEVEFAPQAILNKGEARVFRELDRMVIARNPEWQVMAQVCVEEFVRSEDDNAHACINSKRVDLLLMDEHCHACHALEYQGKGHHQGTAAARDAVKKEALRKAGIGFHEIVAGHTTPAELKRLVPAAGERGKAA